MPTDYEALGRKLDAELEARINRHLPADLRAVVRGGRASVNAAALAATLDELQNDASPNKDA
jgi:hypothetical protein